MKIKTIKTSVWLSLVFALMAGGILKAEPKIGVQGNYAQMYFARAGVEFDRLSKDDFLDIHKIKRYPVLVYQARDTRHLNVIRQYLKNGGIMYWEYPRRSDIAGAVDASGGYSPGACFKLRAEKKHPIIEGLEPGKWFTIEHPLESRLNYARTHGLLPQEENCEVILSVEVSKLEEKGKDKEGRTLYAPAAEKKTYPWLVIYKYGNGKIITGLNGMFSYKVNVASKEDDVINKVLMNLLSYMDKQAEAAVPIDIPANKIRKKRVWQGLEKASINRSRSSTFCALCPSDNLVVFSRQQILDKLKRYNAGGFYADYSNKLERPEVLAKIEWLRKQGYFFIFSFGKISSSDWLEGSQGYNEFFDRVSKWAKRVDIIGCDEWYFSPAVLRTQGSRKTVITKEFLDAFKKYSGYSEEDAIWAFKNQSSADPRAKKVWEFCEKTANDFMKNFVKVAKQSNPDVKTWISYITHNWNKLVSAIDIAIEDFDQILDCQTYWYGRYADDPLNAAKITNAIGLGKIVEAEHPGKFLWVGFGPGYAGAKPYLSEKNKWQNHWSRYHNSPEEVVPYLATLYASSDGVFIFTVFNGNGPGDGSDDDFEDVVRLVSNLVPRVRPYVKSSIAYYHNPRATWEIVRRGNKRFANREGNRVSVGFLQQFCDVDVTDDIKGYKNVISSGFLLPECLDYTKQNVYLMYRPEFNEDGEKLGKEALAKLGMEGLFRVPTNHYAVAGDVEIEKAMAMFAMGINQPDKPLRKLVSENKEYVIASRNNQGNILIDSLCPFTLRQNAARKIIKKDLDYFGWAKRDCPQINGTKDIVAVSLKDPRIAVVDFGDTARHRKVKITVFNGKDGIIRNEVISYKRGMKVSLPSLSVLVAHGLE